MFLYNEYMTVYLLQVSLDIEGENLEASPRLQAAVQAIKSLTKKNNKIVLLGHRGRPKRFEKNLSLKPFQAILSKKLSRKVIFLSKFNFQAIRREISSAPLGSVFLLENLRFLSGETKNSAKLAKELSSLGDLYINDDFATSHRVNASNVGISKLLPSRLGPTFKNEVKNLNKILKKPKKPMVLIIGGVKMTDKIGVIKNLLPKVDSVLLGGGPANTFLKARGFPIGKSIFEKELVRSAKALSRNRKVVLPMDFKVDNSQILDIGPNTLKNYERIINGAKTIVWGGPVGLFEKPGFEEGTYGVAKAIAESEGFSVVGGGETTEVIAKLGLEKKINFISTGGGAMLAYLAGKKLPALKYIKR